MNAFGNDIRFTFEAIWKVLLWSIILGAGLPAIFALAVRSLAWGAPAEADGHGGGQGGATVTTGGGHPAGKIIAGILLLIVIYCVAAAIVFIIATGKGDNISFAHIIPTITSAG